MIRLRGLVKQFPGAPHPAIDHLDLTVDAGEVCVLIGPSGCGKTTTMRMINRLIEPTGGTIEVNGKDVTHMDPVALRRGIGYVIQQVGLFPHMTIAANIATVPRLLGWDDRRTALRIVELLVLVGMEPASFRDRYPRELSGGQRQRIGVARALAADPPVLLMDEPFGAVDPIVRERLQNELLRLQEQLAKTIIFVTHDIDEAIKMGDLVAVMQTGGHLAQFGPPTEILSNPASDFVARFVGADRGLKRLALIRVSDLELRKPPTASAGDDAAVVRARVAADPFPYLLLVDGGDRPLGWLDDRRIPASGHIAADGIEPAEPLLDRHTTLKDALSMLLEAGVQAGIVVNPDGAVAGIVTIETIIERVRPA